MCRSGYRSACELQLAANAAASLPRSTKSMRANVVGNPFHLTNMAARDPVQQGAAIQRRAQAAQQNFAQQLRFELGVQERFAYFLESYETVEEPTEEGGQEQRRKPYREKVISMAEKSKNLLEVIRLCAC